MFDKLKYIDNFLYYDDVNLFDIVKRYKTPIYVYSQQKIIDNYNLYKNSFNSLNISNYQISFAVKANDNLSILKILKDLGCGADVVSIGELKKVLLVGFDASKIVFSGVAKTEDELLYAIENNVGQINIESYEEFLLICKIIAKTKNNANVSVRINPDIDAHTHAKITTGKKNNKFGVSLELAEKIYKEIKNNDVLQQKIHFKGFSVHIGSQILDISVFEKLFIFLNTLYEKYNYCFETLDLGGGIGIQYKENDNCFEIQEYVKLIKKYFNKFNGKIILEPGRSIIGNAGLFLAKIIRIKQTESVNFIILDGGMNNFLRPAMYDAFHMPMVIKKDDNKINTYDIVGPICESSDVFAKNINLCLPDDEENYIAFLCAGAYGRSMASGYNSHELAGEVIIKDKEIIEIRKSISFADLMKFEIF